MSASAASRITPAFYNRAGGGTGLMIAPPDVRYDVDRYTRHAYGGPRRAQIECTGEPEALWQLGTLMRSPVELYDDNGDLCWHGYVHAVRITAGGAAWGLSFDEFANRVAVAYTKIGSSGGATTTRKTTPWASDATSEADYGTKEYLHPANDTTDTAALTERDLELAIRRNLIPTVEPGDGNGESKATLLLRGWWDTLSWRLITRTGAAASTTYAAEPEDTAIDVGTTTSQQAAQGFIISGTGRHVVTMIRAKCVRLGSPADDVLIDVMTGNASAPGTVIGTATIAGVSLPTAHDWVEWTAFTQEAQVDAGTQYCIRVRRSGANDNTNHYRFVGNTALGYASGLAREYNGTAWVAHSPDQDMLFEVRAELVEETTAQAAAMITTAGQFFNGTTIEAVSGVYTPPLRSGDTTALLEIEKLLERGNATGARFLADVTRDRQLRVYTEPSSALPYTLDRNMTLRGPFGEAVPVHRCPAAIWTQLAEPMPGAGPGAGLSFVEEAEYSARTGKWRPVSRRTRNPMRGGRWQ